LFLFFIKLQYVRSIHCFVYPRFLVLTAKLAKSRTSQAV